VSRCRDFLKYLHPVHCQKSVPRRCKVSSIIVRIVDHSSDMQKSIFIYIVFGTIQLDLQLAVIYRCTLDPVFRSATMPLQRVSLNSYFSFFNTQNSRYRCLLDLLRHAGRYSRIPSSPALLASLKAQEVALWSALSPSQLQPMGIHET
jgi:hypothetical protein